MPNAILFAIVQLLETIVSWSLGAILIAVGIAGTIAAPVDCFSPHGRWYGEWHSRGRAPGKQSLTLAAVLAFGFGCVVAGMSLWTR